MLSDFEESAGIVDTHALLRPGASALASLLAPWDVRLAGAGHHAGKMHLPPHLASFTRWEALHGMIYRVERR